jgi:hypothetical protein
MSVQQLVSPNAPARRTRGDILVLAGFGLCVAHAMYLAASFFYGQWLIQPDGHGVPTDFVNVWAAGRLVLDGQAASAYDWTIHRQVENAAVGYNFAGYYAWPYPPPFLFVAALLALFPYAVAAAAWVALTFPLYAVTVRWIAGHRLGFLLAGAFPAVLSTALVGQNGFISAALIGGALGFMERRPVLAGVCLGLLTYKPHFGILFPLVLIAGARWTVFWTAAVVGAALALVSWLAFGTASWTAFFHSLPVTSQAFLSEGQASFDKLQSLYGLVRALGGSESLGWSLHLSLAGAMALALVLLWRSAAAFNLKAAALGVGVVLVTPYAYMYDLVILAIPLAFLVREAPVATLRTGEIAGLGVAAVLLLGYPFVQAPVGLVAALILAILIARRCWPAAPLARASTNG